MGVNTPDRYVNAASDGLSATGIDRSQTNAAGFGV